MHSKTNHYFPRYSTILFCLLYFVMTLIYGYHKTLPAPPQSIHLWRQADCLSLTTNYYQDQNSFLQPSVNYLGQDNTGRTISEFPLLYFVVAKIWQQTGKRIWIYRSIVALFFFLALLALFKLVEIETRNSFLGIFVSLLMFTSPVLVYYSNNFLMNIPAFSLAIFGLYFYFLYRRTNKQRHFLYCCSFYLFGALLKISSLLSFIAIILVLILELFRNRAFMNFNRKKQLLPLLAALLVVTIPFLWYQYAIWYNRQFNAGIFLTGILPIWDMTFSDISESWWHIVDHLRWNYFRPFTEIFIFFVIILNISLFKKIHPSLRLLVIMIGLGVLVFCILFYGALKWHDYYVIDLFIFVPLLFLACFKALNTWKPALLTSSYIPICLLIILIHSSDFARRRISQRYDINDYPNRTYRDIFQAFRELDPLLEKLNIRKDEKVLSLSDHSINISLYFMNRKGWTNYGINMDPLEIDRRIEMGAKYLFIADSTTLQTPILQPYLKHKIGIHRNIQIYDLKP